MLLSSPVSQRTREAAIASSLLAQQAAEAVLHRAQETDAEADPRLGLDVAVGVMPPAACARRSTSAT